MNYGFPAQNLPTEFQPLFWVQWDGEGQVLRNPSSPFTRSIQNFFGLDGQILESQDASESRIPVLTLQQRYCTYEFIPNDISWEFNAIITLLTWLNHWESCEKLSWCIYSFKYLALFLQMLSLDWNLSSSCRMWRWYARRRLRDLEMFYRIIWSI